MGLTSSVQGNISDLGDSSDRPVCDLSEQPNSSVCVTNIRSESLRSRCSIVQLGESPSLRLSSNILSNQGHGEGQSSQLPSDPNSSSMAISTMVHRSVGSVHRGSSQVTSDGQTSEANRKEYLSLKSRSIEPACMEVTKQNLREQGFSDEVSTRIMEPQRPSTRKVYSYRWQKFASWCEGREEDPLKASVPLIAEFLSHLFLQESKKPGTIDGYKTAIADVLQFHSKDNIFGNVHLAKLIKSFYKDTPRQSNIIPKWDLGLVLRHLMKEPFEPIRSTALKYVI